MAYAQVGTWDIVQADDTPTTAGINTTGADLLTVVSVHHSSGDGGTLEDQVNGGSWGANSFTGLTIDGTPSNSCQTRIWWCKPSTVGAAHKFRMPGSTVFGGIAGSAWSGSHATTPAESNSAESAGSGTILQAGLLTPVNDGSLIIAGLGIDLTTGGLTINEGYAASMTKIEPAGSAKGIAAAHWIQTTAEATNPEWTSTNNNAVWAVLAVFAPGVAAAPELRLTFNQRVLRPNAFSPGLGR
jgi:hypothetical protein